MKLERQSVEYAGNTEIRKQSFTVKDTVLIADLLSNMYSNPILAVVREYICNAVDSHVAANKLDVPIKITVPTLLHGYFEVQDYGVGMSESDVYDLMTSYGSSNKRDSNSLVGGFGIGSKSAFAYTKDFTFIATKDGITNVFLCFIDGENGPQVERISQFKTSDPNGVLVKIKVRPTDYHSFLRETLNVTRFLDHPFTPVGFTAAPLKTVHQGNGYRFLETHSGIHIKMGGVVYPTRVSNNLFSNGLILDYPIGSFKLAPSRENIIETNETTTIINKRCEEIAKELNKEFLEKLNKLDNLVDALKFYQSFRHGILRNVMFNYLGKPFSYDLDAGVKDIRYIQESYSYRSKAVKFENATYPSNKTRVTHLGISDKEIIRYNEILTDIKQKSGTQSIVVAILDPDPVKRFYQWIELGCPRLPVIDFDNYQIPKLPKSIKPRKEVQFTIWQHSSKLIKTNIMVPLDDNVKRKYLKIEQNHFQHELLRDLLAYDSYRVKLLINLIGCNEDVIFVPKTLWDRIPSFWVDLEPQVETAINDYLKLKYTWLVCGHIKKSLLLNGAINLQHFKVPEAKYVRKLNKIAQNHQRNLEDTGIFRIDNLLSQNTLDFSKINDIFNRIYYRISKEYPLLLHCSNSNLISHYKNLIENYRQSKYIKVPME